MDHSALIVDDEIIARDVVIHLLEKHCPNVEVVGTADGVETALTQIRKLKPSIVFLDIKMKDGNGFELLDRFHKSNFHVVFMTAYDEFALKAFRYNALDYLLKPIESGDLVQTIARIEDLTNHNIRNFRSRVDTEDFDTIVLCQKYEYHRVKLRDIIYCQSDDNYTNFIITERKDPILCAKTLKHFEQLLPSNQFIRIHQRYLVNISAIKRFDLKRSVLILSNEDQLPVSTRKKATVISELNARK